MKKLFYLLCCVAFTVSAFAQDPATPVTTPATTTTTTTTAATPVVVVKDDDSGLHFGLKAAPSFAWLKTDTKGVEKDGNVFGFSYGLITEFNFTKRYAFATGIDVTYRGGQFKSTQSFSNNNIDSTVVTTAKYKLQYIEVPITLKLKTDEIGYLTYFLQAGLTPGFNIRSRADLSGSIQVKDAGGTVVNKTYPGEDNRDVSKDINFFNISMVIGAGVEYTLSGSTVLLAGVEFNNGFLDVFSDNNFKANSNFLALKLGVLF